MRRQALGRFEIVMPPAEAIGLFTPEGERAWVPAWNPTYPAGQPSEDSGTVFVTTSGDVETIWVVLEIDRRGAIAAYARITPGHHAGTARVECAEAPNGHSVVTVTYDMTLLGGDPAELDVYAEPNFEHMMREWANAVGRTLDRPTR